MKLPEIKDELLPRANPNNFDLYQCAFGEGGELEAYAEYIRKKIIQIYESQQVEIKRLEMKLENAMREEG